jgi:CheY-like chemotaxis protein
MQDKRLLICDDEPAFGRFVKNVAEDLGYEVEVTTTWQAFMQAYLVFRPTTIVLDIVMPGMDGIELVGWLGNLRSSARLVIVTGYAPDYAANAKILAEYKGLGPVTTLHKPVEISRLRAALQSVESL